MDLYRGWGNEYNTAKFDWGRLTGIDLRDKVNDSGACYYRMEFLDVQYFLDMSERCQELFGDGNVYRHGRWQRGWYDPSFKPMWGRDLVNARIYIRNLAVLQQVTFYDRLAA
jgi:hypothetical protein